VNRSVTLVAVCLSAWLIYGCATTTASSRGSAIDQSPMYGGMDRQSIPELKAGDEKLISDVSKEFGSREIGSAAFVEQGIRYYQQDNYAMAMKRFNQAWLLEPSNPEVFWGFALIYHDEGKNCDAKNMIDRAIALNLSKPIPLADAGRIYTLCGTSDSSLDPSTKNKYYAVSEELYKKASAISPNNDYIYGSWATAHYWRGEYAQAWEKVSKQRSLGGTPSGQFINLLRQKMPEPK
jgi:tetratricopeptide (TPR) repeat protein